MIRLAIVVIDRRRSTGGYNYLLNLVRVSDEYLADKIHTVLFFSDEAPDEDVARFAAFNSAEIVRSRILRESRRQRSFANALLYGVDFAVRDLFDICRVDVVFETAQFFGWRLRQPIIAWLTDFQHRILRQLFSFRGFWKRELGFRIQTSAGRTIMLSSEDARDDCERFYPSTRGRTHVVRFAVAAVSRLAATDIDRVRNIYALPEAFYFLPNQFWIHKNHECVIRALAELKRQGHNVVVAASGNPSDPRNPQHANTLKKLASDLGVTKNFRMLGMIPTAHLCGLMQCCVALINPSLSEGWSTTVEEAKAAGTPLILSDLRVHREQASGAAVFFDPTRFELLAEILRAYVPLDCGTRTKLALEANAASTVAVKRYAQDFFRVVEAAANG